MFWLIRIAPGAPQRAFARNFNGERRRFTAKNLFPSP
jgi:hypothetical protein